ncbi:MAG: amidohydrolase family protein [Halioglobus sp.]
MNLARTAAVIALFLLLSVSMALNALQDHGQRYDLVINHGRVIDPETALDDVRHLGIRGGKIITVSKQPLSGRDSINAKGLVVSPGFIDLHTHSPTELGQHYQLFDGVTTALELEAGSFPVPAFAQAIEKTALINYGTSAGYISIRLLHKNGILAADAAGEPKPINLKGWFTAAKTLFMDFNEALSATFTEAASEDDRTVMANLLHEGLNDGALGIGLPLDYISEAVDSQELRMIFRVAAERGAPLFVHIRRGINGDPAGLREVIALATEFGSAIHICHISHNAMKNIDLFLNEIRAAQQQGVDITTEVLPYNAGSALISSAVFGRDWQTIFDISYEDVEWAATGERLTQKSFNTLRKTQPTGDVIHHYLKDEWTIRALQEPGVIVVSDLLPMKSKDNFVAPHNGAFTRVLGHYSRDNKVLDLATAIRKMTLLPAQRLEHYAPAFRTKGRIQVGMDADITIFDALRVKDRASYKNPYLEAAGLAYVVIDGKRVISDGKRIPNVYAGKRITAASSVRAR